MTTRRKSFRLGLSTSARRIQFRCSERHARKLDSKSTVGSKNCRGAHDGLDRRFAEIFVNQAVTGPLKRLSPLRLLNPALMFRRGLVVVSLPW